MEGRERVQGRVEAAGHGEAEQEDAGSFAAVRGADVEGRRRELSEGVAKVDDEAEALEAVADGVEAKEEEFVGGGEPAAGLAEKGGGEGAGQDGGRVEVKGERVLDVVVELDGGGAAVPLAVVVVGGAGAEAEGGEDGFGGGEVAGGDEEVEVVADAECGVAVEAFGEEGAFERNDGKGRLGEGLEEPGEFGGPVEGGDCGFAVDRVELAEELRGG